MEGGALLTEMEPVRESNPVEAVQRLFLKNAEVLKGFMVGLMPDFAAADDVFQEVFVAVTRLAPKFQPGSDFLAWARSIAWLKTQEAYRQRKAGPRPLRPEVLEALIGTAVETEDTWDRRRKALAACMERLSPRARQIVELRYSDDPPSSQEIARRLSWTLHAVDVALTRARRWLRECAGRALRGGMGISHG